MTRPTRKKSEKADPITVSLSEMRAEIMHLCNLVDSTHTMAIHAKEAAQQARDDAKAAKSRMNMLREILLPDFWPKVGDVVAVSVQHLKDYPVGSLIRVCRVDSAWRVKARDGMTFKRENLRAATDYEVAAFNQRPEEANDSDMASVREKADLFDRMVIKGFTMKECLRMAARLEYLERCLYSGTPPKDGNVLK